MAGESTGVARANDGHSRTEAYCLRVRPLAAVKRRGKYLILLEEGRQTCPASRSRTGMAEAIRSDTRSPGSLTRSVCTCQCLRPRWVIRALALPHPSVSPSAGATASAPSICKLSRLNGWPVRSPADASLLPSRAEVHGSGSMWIATPSSCRTCTNYSLPVSRRTAPLTTGDIIMLR